MITFRQLSPTLRALICAPMLCLVGLFAVAATPSTRQLLLDAFNRPTSPVSLSSSNWIGTLDPARLPATVPLLDGGGSLNLSPDLRGGNLNLYGEGGISLENGGISANNWGITEDGFYYGDGSPLSNLDASNINSGTLDPTRLLDEYGQFDLEGDLRLGGNFYVNGSVLVDSSGNFYANGQLIADTNANLYANNLYAGGNLLADGSGNLYINSNLLGDAQGQIYASGNLIGDVDGYLHTGGKTYQAGAVTPTGFLTFKDAAGTIYRVPAAHAP